MIELSALGAVDPAWPQVGSWSLLGRLLLAAVLGGIVGLEREFSGKPAGLRTNILICVGAALLMELSIGVAALANAENIATATPFRADTARIAAQIVSGIGFLGAGTILQARGNVIGLTTAATIWVVAAIGMAVGAQAYIEAVGATVLVLISLALLARLEFAIIQKRQSRHYLVVMKADPEVWKRAEQTIRGSGLSVEAISVEKADDRLEVAFRIVGAAPLQDRMVRDLVGWTEIRRVSRTDS